MKTRTLNSFVPTVYSGVKEIDELIRVEQNFLNKADLEMERAFENTFVLTADYSGIKMFEDMLSIVADPSKENLQFRRQRVINRLSMSPPFTFRFLKGRLDSIIGEGKWLATIDFDTYTLRIESSATNQNWFEELNFTINLIKPCNIVFLRVPYTLRNMHINEKISYDKKFWRYRLGSWKLGSKPFSEVTEGGVIKMPETRSIDNSLLEHTASFVVSDVHSVLINDSVTISEFKVKQASGSQVILEYEVLDNSVSTITNIKLKDRSGNVLSQSDVFVPVTQSVICKHILNIKEGI